MDSDEEQKHQRNRPKRRKEVSKRVLQKRRQEFDIRSAGKGESSDAINMQWTRYYEGVLGGAEPAAQLQRDLAGGESHRFIFTALADFPRLSFATQKLLTPLEATSSTFSIPTKDLSGDFKEVLERELRLGRCILQRRTVVVSAMRQLDVQPESTVLDILADGESLDLCFRSQSLVVLLRKAPPVFDSPFAVWRQLGTWTSRTQFDRILCRVPNSQDGEMTSRKDWIKWKTSNGQDLRAIQLKIAFQLVRDNLAVGGKLVYVTSSLNPVENAQVVEELIKVCNGALHVMGGFIHTAASEPGGGGFSALLEKRGEVRGEEPVADLARSLDCMAALKNSSCGGSQVGIPRHRPVEEEPAMLESNLGLARDLKLGANFSVLSQGTESFLCSPEVEKYFDTEGASVRRCGALLQTRGEGLEKNAVMLVKDGLNVIHVEGDEQASHLLRLALKDKLVPFPTTSQVDADENFYLVRLSFTEEMAKAGDRISKAHRKRMKKDPSTKPASGAVTRTCWLFGRVSFAEEGRKMLEITNDEDWLESCAIAMFSSL